MIKIENVEVYGFDSAIRGMRNPLNSWDKSDSHVKAEFPGDRLYVGENDFELMKKLVKAGSDHRKFARFIDVTLDITAPLYFWKEFKTYRKDRKFLDDEDFYDYDDYADYEIEEFIEMNSCSTMHKIHSKEFTLDDFSHEHLITENLKSEWRMVEKVSPVHILESLIYALNDYRKLFLETKDKKYWWQIIQLLPSSYNQRRTVKLNYEVLKRMYHSRKNHKLDEWREFCKWIESLPYSKLITGTERNL